MDPQTRITVNTLKIWHAGQEWELAQFVNIYETCARFQVVAISNTKFAVAINNKTQIWEKEQNWFISSQLTYRNLQTIQIVPNQRLRVPDVSKAAQLVVLYEDGHVVYWN